MKPATNVAAYVVCYAKLCEVARAHGYALAVHGSVNRDMDLIAVPWTNGAVEALVLIKALRECAGGCWFDPNTDDIYHPYGAPTTKPHGRIAYSIHFTNRGAEGPYLDVSVMPRIPEKEPQTEDADSKV